MSLCDLQKYWTKRNGLQHCKKVAQESLNNQKGNCSTNVILRTPKYKGHGGLLGKKTKDKIWPNH